MAMGDYLIRAVEALDVGLEVASPRDPAQRGSQVAFRHPAGYAIVQALIAENVIGDFREPDILRFGFSPLYNRFRDLETMVAKLEGIVKEGRFLKPEFNERKVVT